jgi:gliding motility-associated-like protein
VFYIPNVFTPNSDGLNEVFKIGGTGLENYQKCNIEIYNSWGERVMYYSEQGMDKFSWDGSYKGKTVPAGIYLFKMHFATIDRQSKTVISEITVVK